MNCTWCWASRPVRPVSWSILLSLFQTKRKLVTAISVSPHTKDSKMASWINTYCACSHVIIIEKSLYNYSFVVSFIGSNYKIIIGLLHLISHYCLDHFHSLKPHVVNDAYDVHPAIFPGLTQSCGQNNENTSTANTSTKTKE